MSKNKRQMSGRAQGKPSSRGGPSQSDFPANPEILARWAYVQDSAGDAGFYSGEFVLLTDGRAFERNASSFTSSGQTSWEASSWQHYSQWGRSTNVVHFFDYLASRGYDLSIPTPVPVTASAAGPFSSSQATLRPVTRLDITAFSADIYARALEFAAAAHLRQTVPGKDLPYLVHVVKVTTEVIGATENDAGAFRNLALACALLHDTVEDAAPSERPKIRAGILSEFGAEVLAGVEALTKNDELPKDARMPDSLRRIRDQPRAVWLVKLADRITNLEPPPATWTAEKCRRYAEEARQILDALGAASSRLRDRFERRLEHYERRYCGTTGAAEGSAPREDGTHR